MKPGFTIDKDVGRSLKCNEPLKIIEMQIQ